MYLDPVAPALEFFARHGLPALFLLLVIDAAGIPIPTEIVMIMAVALYATDTTSLALIIALSTAAALVGSVILYGVCYAGGRRLVERRPRLFMMNPRRLERMERLFRRPVGQSLVFFLRVIPLTRVLVTIPAGIARMRFGVYLVLTLLGMVIYHTFLGVLAFRYGASGGGSPLQAALDSGAWEFVQANKVLTFLVLLALGLLLSYSSSRSTLKDPEWSSPSRIGWVAERIAVLGGLLVVVLVLVDVGILYRALDFGGVDLPALAERIDWDAESFLVFSAWLALIAGLPAIFLARAARRKKEDWWAVKYGLREDAVVITRPAGTTSSSARPPLTPAARPPGSREDRRKGPPR